MHAQPCRIVDVAPAQPEHLLSEAELLIFCAAFLSDAPMYERFANEARFGLARLLPVIASLGGRVVDILEVGAGSCILAAYLTSKNLRVTAVEPLGSEFGFFTDLHNRVLEHCRQNAIPLKVVRTTGEELDLPNQFDIAFTINALEHMSAPLLVIDNMYRSLKPGGVLLAHCANYTIPFDTHFNILLVTRSKRVNEWLYRSKIDRYPEIWSELNFIRYIDVCQHLQRRGVRFRFDNSIMGYFITRTLTDRIFAERMPVAVRAISKLLQWTRLVKALTLLPARWQTPMEVLIKKP